jgi:hypothetical protein
MGESYKLVRIQDDPSFFKRHGKWVSFIGALIVFSTFVVKDAIRENLKNLVDSLASAENNFAIREDSALLSTEIAQIS